MSNDKKSDINTLTEIDGKPLSEALRARRQKELRLQREAKRRAGKTSISQKFKTHRYWIPRALYYLLHSIWIAAIAIGGFIAWLISLIFL